MRRSRGWNPTRRTGAPSPTRPWKTGAFRQRIVTSDDVWAELDRLSIPRPPEGRAMGPVMQWGIREGYLTPAGFTQGTQKAHHADVMRTYRSNVAR